MNCKGCIYLGQRFEHINELNGCKEWRYCKYPLPWFYTQKAVPIVEDHNCKVKLLKKVE